MYKMCMAFFSELVDTVPPSFYSITKCEWIGQIYKEVCTEKKNVAFTTVNYFPYLVSISCPSLFL